MPKGGARVVSGPPPDPNSLRQERAMAQGGWTTLPAEGRTGAPPQWPLTQMTEREEVLWADMWARPQAVMWERLGQGIEVAMFCRKLSEAELPKASVELQKVVRQYLDSLGLSVQGMLRNRWKIAAGVAEPVPARKRAAAKRAVSARSRLKVVASDGDG